MKSELNVSKFVAWFQIMLSAVAVFFGRYDVAQYAALSAIFFLIDSK